MENLLKAGMQAPSACNQQPWEFIVIEDDEDKVAISNMHKFAKPAGEASRLIVVLGNLKEAKIESMIDNEEFKYLFIESIISLFEFNITY